MVSLASGRRLCKKRSAYGGNDFLYLSVYSHGVLSAFASISRHLIRTTSVVYVTLAVVVAAVADDDVVSESRDESSDF